jgi:replication-associated recombination protein RarA
VSPAQSDRHLVGRRRKFAIPGFQHKLGLLLHGPPGTGKTSLVKVRYAHAVEAFKGSGFRAVRSMSAASPPQEGLSEAVHPHLWACPSLRGVVIV